MSEMQKIEREFVSEIGDLKGHPKFEKWVFLTLTWPPCLSISIGNTMVSRGIWDKYLE